CSFATMRGSRGRVVVSGGWGRPGTMSGAGADSPVVSGGSSLGAGALSVAASAAVPPNDPTAGNELGAASNARPSILATPRRLADRRPRPSLVRAPPTRMANGALLAAEIRLALLDVGSEPFLCVLALEELLLQL